jgi:hypothetical protein
MIVFKDYFKILKKHKGVIILYVIILLFFSSFSVENNSNNTNFEATKPNIAFINNDTDSNIVNNFKNYLENNTNIVDVSDDNDSLSDALFYQDVDAVIYIYNGYTNDYLNNNYSDGDLFITEYNPGLFTYNDNKLLCLGILDCDECRNKNHKDKDCIDLSLYISSRTGYENTQDV